LGEILLTDVSSKVSTLPNATGTIAGYSVMGFAHKASPADELAIVINFVGIETDVKAISSETEEISGQNRHQTRSGLID
jgi:hypothetical protein